MRGRISTSLLLCLCIYMGACATIGPPQPPSLELPKPPTDLHAVRKGDEVTLRWTIPSVTTDRQSIRSLSSTRICRGIAVRLTECGTPVGEAVASVHPVATDKSSGQKTADKYIDALPTQIEEENPLGFVTYAVEVLNANRRGAGISNQVQVPLAPTLLPPRDFAAHVTAQGIVLTWTGESSALLSPSHMHYIDRVYRHAEGSQSQTLVGEIPLGVEFNMTLTDSSIEWEQTYDYRAETVTVIAADGRSEVEVEGEDTPEVKIFAHDIFPPAVPSGLQAVFSGPGQQPFIDLVWAPVTDMDLVGYNVYRSEGSAAVKLNDEPLKTPAYRDALVASGKRYVYSVSSVDLRGNESAQSEEAGENVP